MSWSADFVAALSSPTLAPIFVVEVVNVWHEPGGPYSVSSIPGVGASESSIVRGSVTSQGATLSPVSATASVGSWSFGIAGDPAEFLRHVTRGTIVQLRVGWPGWSEAEYETVALGQVSRMRGIPPVLMIEVMDIYAAIQSRLEIQETSADLFADAGTTTALAADYTVGDASLKITSTAGFVHRTGGDGAALVTPTSGATPFILTYTGVAAGPVRLTGVSAAGQLGTTALSVLLADGATITALDLVYGHPLDIVREVMCSTGVGTNGSYDVYPEAWGMCLPDTMMDHTDIDAYKAIVTVAGVYTWKIASAAGVPDGYSWLVGYLAPGGLFLAVRQGLLTARAIQDTALRTYHTGIAITDADIIAVEDYQAYDDESTPEGISMVVNPADGTGYGTGLTPPDAATLPTRRGVEVWLPALYANTVQVCTEVYDRTYEAFSRVPERITLRCVLRLAQLAVGDLVDLTTLLVWSRRDGLAGFTARCAMVVEVSPDWSGGSTVITLLVYPESDDVYA